MAGRKLPSGFDLPAVPGLRSGRPGYREESFDIETVTPMIGGGPVPGAADRITPVRGTAVRGHLRFWWRAMARPQTLESLQKRESRLWGVASEPGLIDLSIENVRADDPIDNWTYYDELKKRLGSAALSARYALFPLQKPSVREGREMKPRAGVTERVRFRLLLRFVDDPAVARNLIVALRAWILFGGLGARTRRGCGALSCRQMNPLNAGALLRESYPPLQSERLDFTELGARPVVLPQEMDPRAAWMNVITVYREFRQGTPGERKKWPEGEMLRDLRRNGKRGGQYSCPRTSLGLPIVFHFKDSWDSDLNGELAPANSGRMASPVILKPIAVADGGRAVPAIVRLATAGVPSDLQVKFTTAKEPVAVKATGTAVEDLIAYARKRGYQG